MSDQDRLLQNMYESMRENQMREELEQMREERIQAQEYEEARIRHEVEAMQYQQYAGVHFMTEQEIMKLKENVLKSKHKNTKHFDEELFKL